VFLKTLQAWMAQDSGDLVLEMLIAKHGLETVIGQKA
jgi:hypothetical protein